MNEKKIITPEPKEIIGKSVRICPFMSTIGMDQFQRPNVIAVPCNGAGCEIWNCMTKHCSLSNLKLDYHPETKTEGEKVTTS